MSEKGFIKLYRQSLDHPLFNQKPFDYWHAWEDILLNVNYKKTERFYKSTVQVTYPGQMQTSLPYLADRWGWSVNKVRRFLVALEAAGMLNKKCNAHGTTLTVENWGKFQVSRHANEYANEYARGMSDGIHKKNSKEYKEERGADLAKKPSAGAIKVGDIFTDSEGFKYIKKSDGSIDRYRGK